MDISIGKWLFDILNSIHEIETFFQGREKNYFEYCQNLMLKKAVERNLEIIGEAVNRILHKDSTIKISSARQIVQFRNIIIHSYDNISDANVWAVVINHLPKLKNEVTTILNENFPNFPTIL